MVNNRILQLDLVLANQIAAGEVVERPASVIKELLENSLDAGATAIEVDIEGGGSRLIRVRDDGKGIDKDDLVLAFARHATSKISTLADLTAIGSLGFRGEALASIASVSRCRLISKPCQQDNAWQIQIAPDLSPTLQPVAHPSGTTVEVADLFYNTPARRRFLRSEKTEFQAIEEIFKRLALAYPAVSFRLKHHETPLRFFPQVNASQNENARLTKICGQPFMSSATEVSLQAVGLQLKGWLGSPSLSRRQSDCQYFFVNQRAIKDRLINHVIKSIYQEHSTMVEGSYPCYVLYLTMDPSEVDVNVHPTKQEVRFGQSRLVHDFMAKCVQQALLSMPLAKLSPKQDLEKKAPLALQAGLRQPMPSMPEKKHPASINRYILLEEAQEIIIVDLLQAKTALLIFYFQQKMGHIPTRALLFPQRFKFFNPSTELADLSKTMASMGFYLRWERSEAILLQQPALLTTTLDSQILQQMMAAQTIDKRIEIIASALQLENLALLPYPEFSLLLKAWMKQGGAGPWLKLSQAQLGALMAQASPTFAMTD